jgi:hypothetical protein
VFGNIVIERASLRHVDGIFKLAEENSPESGGKLTGALPRDAIVATIQVLPSVVAVSGNEVLGFLLAWEPAMTANPCVKEMLEAYPGADGAYVYGPICVSAVARGRGVAGRMFAELRALLPGREGILFIKADNESSLRAHHKMGMRKTAEYLYEGSKFVVFAYRG